MKLYHIPSTCSLAIQALLEETGETYELVPAGAPESEERARYLQINPKGKVPALQLDDGSLLTEFPAIAVYIARLHDNRQLLGHTPIEQARIIELLEYIVSTGHMQGFSRIMRPYRFSENEQDHPQIRSTGLAIFQDCLDLCDRVLEGREFACGKLSIADFALLYIEHWSASRDIGRLGDNCRTHYDRMKARPAIAKALG